MVSLGVLLHIITDLAVLKKNHLQLELCGISNAVGSENARPCSESGRGLTARSGSAREVQALPQRGRASSDPKLSYTRRSPTREGAPPRRSEHRRPPPVGWSPREAQPRTPIWGHPSPEPQEPKSNRSARSPGRTLQTPPHQGRPPTHTHMSPSARSPRSGRGAPDFLDSFCVSETEQPPGPRRLARHSLYCAPPRFQPVPGGLAGARG